MKNISKFAHLISFLSITTGMVLDDTIVQRIEKFVDECNEHEAEPVLPAPSVYVSSDQRLEIEKLLSAVVTERKLDSIVSHRSLTGYGLKESKDLIEAAMSLSKKEEVPYGTKAVHMTQDELDTLLIITDNIAGDPDSSRRRDVNSLRVKIRNVGARYPLTPRSVGTLTFNDD